MPTTFKDMIADARTRVACIAPRDAGGLILDIREPGEAGRVPGSLCIPRGLLESRADPESAAADARLTGAKPGPIDVLCASGARAALAADTLRAMGFEARVIEGGIAAWRDAGLAVED